MLRWCLGGGLLLCSCGSDDPTPTAPTTTVTHATESDIYDARDDYVIELARSFGCEVFRPISSMDAPIRGGAARAGVACMIDSVTVDVFDRPDPDDDRGGSIEHIRQLVGATGVASCGWLAIGDAWFLVANDRATLERAAEMLGGSVVELHPAFPLASYQMPGGCA